MLLSSMHPHFANRCSSTISTAGDSSIPSLHFNTLMKTFNGGSEKCSNLGNRLSSDDFLQQFWDQGFFFLFSSFKVDSGKVDGDRLCISGGSAGGYTTLAALAFRETFKAGASLYGVADLNLLRAETHKFESRYFDSLVDTWTRSSKILKDDETRS